MENLLRAALLAWLRLDEDISDEVNIIEEEAPVQSTPPWLGIAASASIDWSTKGRAGWESRIALELHTRSDNTAVDANLIEAIRQRIENLPRQNTQFELVTSQFIKARSEHRKRHQRAVLLEYRFRYLANPSE